MINTRSNENQKMHLDPSRFPTRGFEKRGVYERFSMAVEAGVWDWPDRGLSARGLPLGEEVTKNKKGGVRERRCEPNEGKRGSRHTGSNLLLPWAFIAGLHSVVNLLVKNKLDTFISVYPSPEAP